MHEKAIISFVRYVVFLVYFRVIRFAPGLIAR